MKTSHIARPAGCLLASGLFALLPLPAFGKYMRVETKDIPLERLLTNLTEVTKAAPADANALHQLARTHAIAYSRRLGDDDPVAAWSGWRGEDPEQPWFGYQPPHVPYHEVAATGDEKKIAAAKAHLAAAIEAYKKALAAKPDDNTIKLGFAWCQDQAGKKAEAITLYRAVAAKAWEVESKRGGGLGNFLYVETAGYLLPHLDPEKDAAEIARLEEGKKKLLSLPRAVTPLVVPVGADGGLDALVDRDARVRFDLDGSGRQLEWPWITRDAAWLVFDPTGAGRITSSIQMFGSRSFLLFCNDGYQALALLDDDRDGSVSGVELDGLALWNDRNSDGISDPGEVRSVAEHGISSLSTRSQRHSSGIPYSAAGVTFSGGITQPTFDLILRSQ